LSKLTQLECVGNSLLTEIPSSLSNLTNLSGLALRDNNLSQLPDNFGNFPNLVDLSLSRNHIKTLPPSIGNMKKLEYFEISSDSLVNIPNEIGKCSSLLYLMIDDNQLAVLPDSIINLTVCNAWVNTNGLCSLVTCPVQKWLEQHVGVTWQDNQRCTVTSLPVCTTNAISYQSRVANEINKNREPVKIYDLKGNYICSANSSLSKLKLPKGLYIVRYSQISGIKTKIFNKIR
jgi:Leucine-rich repeat (LRR) protein